MRVVLAAVRGGVQLTVNEDDGDTSSTVPTKDLPARVHELEQTHRPRWVWADTSSTYPALLQAGVRVERCHDLRLCHVILRRARATAESVLATADPGPWDVATDPAHEPTLLDDIGPPLTAEEVLAEHDRQLQAVDRSAEPGRLRLLLAAESVGALVAAEMAHDGLPWDLAAHDRLLTDLLGPRPAPGGRPAVLEALAVRIRDHLGVRHLNPDSPAEVLRALHSAGLEVRTTRKWELAQIDHPAIAPLLEYKKLARLLSANGWAWMDAWIHPRADGPGARFRPDYVPGGVVTGRWATSGGGALQLPKQIRAAVVADPGWKLVVADVAQLEPRVLAAMSGDEQMARAARGADLYQGLVDQGIVDTRAHAKVAMLGALYGATTGEAGQLMPRLLRAFPRATGVVERAARTGESGGVVTTWLGRTSPPPSDSWRAEQRRASEFDATETDVRRARQQARDWGRFTRNFVVQGTAAEWALCWMADLRIRLRTLADASEGGGATGTGVDGGRAGTGAGEGGAATGTNGAPHLVFFLHDEVIVHSPEPLADQVAEAVRAAATAAGELLFGGFPVDFPLDVAVVDNYAEAD